MWQMSAQEKWAQIFTGTLGDSPVNESLVCEKVAVFTCGVWLVRLQRLS